MDALKFEYRVPQSISRFRVQGSPAKSAVVPYHGTFLADAATFRLIRMDISASKIPLAVGICTSDSKVDYQLAWISGKQTVIPKTVSLEMTDETQLRTVSRNEYSGCREFRAESKLRFDSPEIAAAAGEQRAVETWLPAGLKIAVELVSPIDEKTAYTGDPVQGNVLAPVQDKQGATLIPKDAVLRGVITQLQRFYQPESLGVLQLQFNEVTFDHRTFRLKAVHDATSKDAGQRAAIFDGSISEAEQQEIDPGAILFRSSHLRLANGFRGQWRTVPRESAPAEVSRE